MRIARTGRSYQTGRLAILIYTIFLFSFSQGCPGIIQSLTGYRLLIAEKMPMGSLSFKASVSHPHTHLQSIWSYQRNNLPSQFLVSTFIQSFILAISIAPLQVHYYSETLPLQHGYCIGVSRRNAHATVSKGLSQGLYVAVRAEVEPRTYRLRDIDLTNVPPRPTMTYEKELLKADSLFWI